jgi:putative sigma-54 modulation protein
MINAIEISGIQFEIDDTTRKYVTRKIGRLDRYLPRHARKSVTAEVKLRQANRDHGNKYEAEVILNLPDKVVMAKDYTMNILAALDIVEAKLVTQLRKYKQASLPHVGNRGVLSRFKQSYSRESQ